MPEWGYVVYLPDHCVIPVARDLDDDHYSMLHRVNAETTVTLRPYNGYELVHNCTETDFTSLAAAFDPIALHPYDYFEQVSMSSFARSHPKNFPLSPHTQVMSDPLGQLYLRWTLAEHGYATAVPDSTLSAQTQFWSKTYGQILTVEFNSVTQLDNPDDVMQIFGMCDEFREAAQLVGELRSPHPATEVGFMQSKGRAPHIVRRELSRK